MAKPKLAYKRILLKISGEALRGSKGFGIDQAILFDIAKEISTIHKLGVHVALVVGGGNIFRGLSGEKEGIDRVTGDQMGMLATLINSMALQDALEKTGLETRVQSAIEMNKIAEPFIPRKAVRHMQKGRVVIFGGGTGNPFFSTDTTAALRASEIGADIVMKATKVDGIYNKDPKKFKDAKRFKSLTYMDAIKRKLKVMDLTAVSLCMENEMPIMVFDLFKRGLIKKAVQGTNVGTLVYQ